MPAALAYNGRELRALGSRPGAAGREGALLVTSRPRHDGFFRKSEVAQESWCRLIDNLLFISKTAEQWSEIKGVIVLEKCLVKSSPQDEQGHWPIQLTWSEEIKPMQWLQLATLTECDRVGWLEAIQLASHEYIKLHVLTLQKQLDQIIQMNSDIDVQQWRQQKGLAIDLNEVPLCELSLSCDNLVGDSYEDIINPFLELHIKVAESVWIKYGCTEVLENTRNPKFVKTVMFKKNDGLDGETVVRISIKDMREQVSNTSTTIGFATVLLSTIQATQRFRVALKNCDRRTVGFLTLNGWNYESPSKEEENPLEAVTDASWKTYCHRRSQSLPITLSIKIKLPICNEIVDSLFGNIYHSTYRLQSNSGCDVNVHETMAESKLCYLLPQLLLGIWIQHEKDMLQEVVCIGEMEAPWKTNQIELLNKHYSLYKYYNSALDRIILMTATNKTNFKQSCRKDDPNFEFIPVNLHIQRMWAHNCSLNKSGSYDTITVGAFTAHNQTSEKDSGLFQMIQQSNTPNTTEDPVKMASEAVQAIKQLRGEVVDSMTMLLQLARIHETNGMMPLAEKMVTKTQALLSLWDSGLVEEALCFIDTHKISSVFNDNAESTIENSKMFSMLKRMDLKLNLTEAITPDIEDFATPSSPGEDHLQFLDTEAMSSSLSANYYQPHDEPEPWDLTQLNIEASVMCLVSKVKFLCGHRGSPAIRLRGQKIKTCNRTLVSPPGNCKNGNEKYQESNPERPMHLDLDKNLNSNESVHINTRKNSIDNGRMSDNNCNQLAGNSSKEKVPEKKCNRFTEGLNLAEVVDWASELRPSMRKLRQAMDGLLKGGRLAHAILRIQQNQSILQKNIDIQVRRDICFSQALTTLTTGLLSWLWSTDTDIIVALLNSGLGPLCYFEGLLTLYGNEIVMWGDMVIAIEDLQTVSFQIVRWNPREISLPYVKGTRSSLTVIMPVQPELYSKLAIKDVLKFSITPVYFNIGINSKAPVAESLGANVPQNRSNLDNYERLNEYHLRYQKLNITSKTDNSKTNQNLRSIDDIISKMKILVYSKQLKNVELLQEASYVTRRLNGIRFISCKSGKDRTGMACTLEQCNILYRDFELTNQEFKRALHCMRSEGCRRDNTMKNIGVRKYAFNKVEAMTLPIDYRPPLGTYGTTQT